MMRQLIADSGSTKTDWLLIDEKAGDRSFQTLGINPFFRSSEEIYLELKEKLLFDIDCQVDRILFYGAGIVNKEKGDVVKNALSRLFPNATIETHSDVLGASRALFGNQPGIACIMGTGSNACLYDGIKILEGIPPLGFILGDECSGAVLGKKLVGDYFKKEMPEDLRTLFNQQFKVSQVDVLNRVYRTERPNKYLAVFTPFLSQYLDQTYCRELVSKSMVEFFERNVLKLPGALNYPLGFVGSVAHAFKPILEEMATCYGFNEPLVLKEPISGLNEFHKNKR